VIAGGPAPLIATTLFANYGTGYAIAIFIAACAVVSLVSAAFMPDYTGKDISQEYDSERDPAARPVKALGRWSALETKCKPPSKPAVEPEDE